MKETELVDWLLYCSYEANRQRAPEIPANAWAKIFANAAMYEQIYQKRNHKQ